MSYSDDYKKTLAELEGLITEHRDRAAKIEQLQRRIIALQLLMEQDNPAALQELKPAGDLVPKIRTLRMPLTDRIISVLKDMDGIPLTAKEIVEKLKAQGWNIENEANALPTVNSICNRLEDREIAKTTDKERRKAWYIHPQHRRIGIA